MNAFVIFAAAAAPESGGTIDRITRTFHLEPRLFISQLIVFLLLAYLLNKFAYRPLLKMLDERKRRIAESMENAEKIKKELAEAEAARKEILEKANVQANQLIQEARAAAARVQEAESQKAINQAEQIISKAREATEADRDRMLAELKREIGQLVVKTTAQVVGKVLSDEDQRRLIEETNRQIAA